MIRNLLRVRSDYRRQIPLQVVQVGHELEPAFLLELRIEQRKLRAPRRRWLLQNHRPRLLERVFVCADNLGDRRHDLKIVWPHELCAGQNAANPVGLPHVVRMHDNLRFDHVRKSSKKLARKRREVLRGMHGNVRRRFAENAKRGCAGFAVIPAAERESPNVCKNASRFSRHCAESWSNVRRTMSCLPLPRHSERQRREESSNIPFALSFQPEPVLSDCRRKPESSLVMSS